MKPVEGNFCQNALSHGVAGFNIDDARIEGRVQSAGGSIGFGKRDDGYKLGTGRQYQDGGRWPANVILNHSADCKRLGIKKVKTNGHWTNKREVGKNGIYGTFRRMDVDRGNILADENKMENAEDWNCSSSCPVQMLDAQSGIRKGMSGGGAKDKEKKGNWIVKDFNRQLVRKEWIRGDEGGASRFFIQTWEYGEKE